MGKKRSRKKGSTEIAITSGETISIPKQIKKPTPTIIDVPGNNPVVVKSTSKKNIPIATSKAIQNMKEGSTMEISLKSAKKKKKKSRKRAAELEEKDTKKQKIDDSLTSKENSVTATESEPQSSNLNEISKAVPAPKTKQISTQTDSNSNLEAIASIKELKEFIQKRKSKFADIIINLLGENDNLTKLSETLDRELKDSQALNTNLTECEQKMISCHICMDVFSNPQILECGTNPVCNRYAEYHVEQMISKLKEPRKTEVLDRVKEEKEEFVKKKDPWHSWKRPVQYIIDNDDGVTRCGTCGWEIEDGVCENCNARYPDLQVVDYLEEEDYPDNDDHEDSMDTEDEHFVVDDDYIEYESDASRGGRNRRNNAIDQDDYEDFESEPEQIRPIRSNVIDLSDESASDQDVEVTRTSRANRVRIQEFSDENKSSDSEVEVARSGAAIEISEDEDSNRDRNEYIEFSAEEDNFEDSSSD
ncbi:hypothetical protein HDV01_004836 [Terramyces sp. JEL0728]|nr:hypothetical protein HDV01_004836 [Terramyces sp. JEL0728]